MVSETSELRNVVSHLDLLIDLSMVTLFAHFGQEGFDFDIVNFPDLSGNIPTAPVYGTCISQLIKYSRACHNYSTFAIIIAPRHSMPAERLFDQGFLQEN